MHSELEEYILDHIDEEGEHLYRLWRETNKHLLYGRMASGHLQGRLLKMLVRMIKPKRVLEIGTFTGYSAISMAQGLEADGRLWTFDTDDELEDFTRHWIETSEVAEKIEFRIGDALTEAPKLGINFDLIFIDGNKRLYPEYYDMSVGMLNEGGYIIADNTLWDGHVVEADHMNDRQTQGIMEFNDRVAHDDRVEKVILPLRDGLSIIRLCKEKD